MSLEDVKAFYQRLGTDEAFRTQIQGVNTNDGCSQIVKSAGYDFTQEELEEYTLQLLELGADEDELADLDEQELATVFGGIVALQPMYRGIRLPIDLIRWLPVKPSPIEPSPIKPSPIVTSPLPLPQAMYGVVIPRDVFISQEENSK